jgi:hypothetical protein
MPSKRRRALAKALILISTPPAVAGCAHTGLTNSTQLAFSCEALIPASDRTPVAPTPLPQADASAGALWISLDDQTARLDQANGRLADVLDIQQRCEAEQAKGAAAVRPRLFGWLSF